LRKGSATDDPQDRIRVIARLQVIPANHIGRLIFGQVRLDDVVRQQPEAEAAKSGQIGLSLTVNALNPAHRLYERGFCPGPVRRRLPDDGQAAVAVE